MKKLVVGMLALLCICFAGCSEEDPKDIRDAAIGEYSGTVTFYYVVNETLVPLNDIQSLEFEVVKPSAKDELVITFDGGKTECVGVTADGDGFTFNILPYTVDGYYFYGYSGVQENGDEWHGQFKGLLFKFYFEYQVDGVRVVGEASGFK